MCVTTVTVGIPAESSLCRSIAAPLRHYFGLSRGGEGPHPDLSTTLTAVPAAQEARPQARASADVKTEENGPTMWAEAMGKCRQKRNKTDKN